MNFIERSVISKDWITLLLVGCFVLFALLSFYYKKKFEDFIKLPISKNYFINKANSNEVRHPFNLILFVIQIISLSLFVNLFFRDESKLNVALFFQISIGVFVFISLKFGIEKLVGNLFSMEGLIDQYVFQKFTYKNFTSLIIFILNLVFYYVFSPSLTLLGFVTGILVLFNILITINSIKKHRTLLFNHFFYFLLYLCTLEISPYVIVYKALE